jgi:hypothetical protein
MIKGEGCGFEIAQGRLGPGRFQYAMTFVGLAQRCLELMCERATQRVAFGEPLSAKTSIQHEIARSRCEIEQCRLLVLQAAEKMDREGLKGAKDYVSMVKIVGPQMAENVASRCPRSSCKRASAASPTGPTKCTCRSSANARSAEPWASSRTADSNDASALAEAGTVAKAIGDVGEGGFHSTE